MKKLTLLNNFASQNCVFDAFNRVHPVKYRQRRSSFTGFNRVKKFLNYWRRQLIDLLFPKTCLGCGRPETWLCSACREKIIVEFSFYCPGCQKPRGELGVCPNCSASYLNGVYLIAPYADKLINRALKAIKYDLAKDLTVEVLGQYLAKYFSHFQLAGDFLLAPIPLHRRRFLQRGFNQARLIADLIGQMKNLPITDDLLVRVKYNQPQAQLKHQARLENVSGIFRVNNFGLLNKKILLIDDVYTTGATMQEAAKVLKIAGATQVYGLAMARG